MYQFFGKAHEGSLTNVQINNSTTTNDMLSTPLTIDLNESDSSTAATPDALATASSSRSFAMRKSIMALIWVLLMVVVYAVDSLTTLLICSRDKGCEDPGKGTNVWVIVRKHAARHRNEATIGCLGECLQRAAADLDVW